MMNKLFFSFLWLALLAGSSVYAQQSLNDHLKEIDGRMALRQQQWLDAQQKKLKYDTIGLAAYRAEWAELKALRKKQEIAFIKKHPRDTASLRALNEVVGHLPENISACERLYNGLSKELQTSAEGQKLANTISRFMAVRIGATAPAFAAPDTSGLQVALGDFRGKYVLLDFWASWCGPCREENPTAVKAFHQFREKGFTVLSVSLDQPGKKEAWLKAIHDDQLQWQHVSDLKYWNNEVAQLYAVRSIPQNFLIDPSGKIIAANLRGEALMQQLEKILK